MRRTGIFAVALVAVGLTGALPLTGLAAGHAALSSRSCGPVRARTLLRRGDVRAYVVHNGDAFACDAASHQVVPLASPGGESTYLLPLPALTIAGSVIAYGEDYLNDPTGYETVTFIEVRDLGTRPGAPAFDVILPAQPSPLGSGATSKVVTTVVKTDGAVAWISCQEGPNIPESDLAVGRRARCQRPGTYAWVYREDAATERAPGTPDGQFQPPTLLDAGYQISPLSLKLRGSRVTWRHGARTRSATLS